MESHQTKNILIIDDEPHIRLALRYIFEKQGYQVAEAVDGESALQHTLASTPDLIVLDVMMPGMTGFEVAKKIRQMDHLSDTAIIFLTAKGTDQDKMVGLNSGGEIYLTKPFDNDELVAMVSEVLEFG